MPGPSWHFHLLVTAILGPPCALRARVGAAHGAAPEPATGPLYAESTTTHVAGQAGGAEAADTGERRSLRDSKAEALGVYGVSSKAVGSRP